MKEKIFLSSSEFAKLCNTTKDTLFHYEKKGLIKPCQVTEKGYRRYAAEQFFVFDLIMVLKEAGSSLAEIREYIRAYAPQHLLKIVREKQQQFLLEQKRLALRKEALDRIAEAMNEALCGRHGIVKIEYEKEERLVVTAVDDPQPKPSLGVTALNLSRHFNHCAQVGLKTISPVGSIITHANAAAGKFVEKYFFSENNSAVEPALSLTQADIMMKPEGNYATFLHKGSFNALAAEYPQILKRIAKQGYSVAGHAYIYDLLSHLASENEENDVFRLSIQIA